MTPDHCPFCGCDLYRTTSGWNHPDHKQMTAEFPEWTCMLAGWHIGESNIERRWNQRSDGIDAPQIPREAPVAAVAPPPPPPNSAAFVFTSDGQEFINAHGVGVPLRQGLFE